MNLAHYIDHTILKQTTTLAEIEQLCKEAVQYGFAAVCVPPPFVKRVKTILAPSDVKVATVIGFPFGYSATEAKVAETILALVDGADEIDAVINLVALRMNDWDYLQKEVKLLTGIIHQKSKRVKIIIESGELSEPEIIQCCTLFAPINIDFMKTSTGFAKQGATVESVQLMRSLLPSHIKIKASGGIRTYELAKALIAAGAERLGCSASVDIVTGAPDHNNSEY